MPKIHYGSLEGDRSFRSSIQPEDAREEAPPQPPTELKFPDQGRHAQRKPALSNQDPAELKEFYYPGSEDLLEARRFFAKFSIPRAKARIERENRWYASQVQPQVREQREAKLSSLREFELAGSQIGGERGISCCTFIGGSSGQSHLVTGDWGGACSVWSTPGLECVATISQLHPDRISSIAHNSVDLLASAGFDGSIRLVRSALYPLASLQPISELGGHAGRVSRVAFHPSNRFLASTGYDRTLRIWDLERSIEVLKQEAHQREAYALATQCDGSLISTGGLEGICRVWDLRTGNCVALLKEHSRGILSADFSPNGFSLATASEDHSVKLWDLRNLSHAAKTIFSHSSSVTVSKYDPLRGDVIFTAAHDGTVCVTSVYDLKSVASYDQYDTKISSLDVTADLQKFASVSLGRSIKCWTLPSVY